MIGPHLERVRDFFLNLNTQSTKELRTVYEMAVAIAVWCVPLSSNSPFFWNIFRSTVVEPGKKVQILPQADLRLTNASLGDVLIDQNARSSIKLVYQPPISMDDDEEPADEPSKSSIVLCSLTPGKVSPLFCGDASANIFLSSNKLHWI